MNLTSNGFLSVYTCLLYVGFGGIFIINIFLMLLSGKLFKQVKIVHFLRYNKIFFKFNSHINDYSAINGLQKIFILLYSIYGN